MLQIRKIPRIRKFGDFSLFGILSARSHATDNGLRHIDSPFRMLRTRVVSNLKAALSVGRDVTRPKARLQFRSGDTHMKFEATFLTAPGTGRNTAGKFYIAIAGQKACFTMHGPNNPNSSGTVTDLADTRAVKAKVREKLRKSYTQVDPAGISKAARDRLIAELRKRRPELAGLSFRIERDGIEFSPTAGGTARAPRSVKSPIRDMWF